MIVSVWHGHQMPEFMLLSRLISVMMNPFHSLKFFLAIMVLVLFAEFVHNICVFLSYVLFFFLLELLGLQKMETNKHLDVSTFIEEPQTNKFKWVYTIMS